MLPPPAKKLERWLISLTTRIPRTHDDASARWIVLYHAYALGQLVHALTRVVIMHRLVSSTGMSPLETVHGPEVAWNASG